MTGRATFGDFADAITRQLGALPRPALSRAAGEHRTDRSVPETALAVRTAMRPMASHVADVMAVFDKIDTHQYHRHIAWLRAAKRARQALASAEAFLEAEFGHGEPAHNQASNRKTAALLASAASMAASRDLLHTHSATRADDTRELRSEWAPVITSIPIARAVLLEVAGWASQIAPHCSQTAISVMTGTREQRRALNSACQWLWTLAWAVEAAHEQQPVAAGDIALLHAIPAISPAPRHLPSGQETIAGLCDGIITAAERAHSAALADARTPPPAGPASESFRHIAGNCTVTSWNCHLVLRALAARTDLPPELRTQFRDATDTADQARAGWLRAATEWDTTTTSVHGGLSAVAADAGDLALWTGRLAYADPHWTPALGPASPSRSPNELVTSRTDMRHLVTALHHTCHAISQLAAHQHEQAQEAAAGRQLVVPARNLTDSSSGRYLFGFATPADASLLRSAYRDAKTWSERTEKTVGAIAAAIRAPSRALTATQITGRTRTAPAGSRAADLTARLRKHAAPGPAERVLRDLGVTHGADLTLASDLDKATSQLILRAARTTGPAARRSPNLRASAGTAELINHLLGTSEGNAAFNHPEPAPGPRDQTSGTTARVLLRTQLTRTPAAPSQARRHLRQALTDNGLAALTDNAELLTSELVANTAEHGQGTTIGLTVSETTGPGGRPGITCEISDRSPRLPERQRAGPGDERGQGLAILDALAADHGVRTDPDGKTCWFTLTAAPPGRKAEPQIEHEAGA